MVLNGKKLSLVAKDLGIATECLLSHMGLILQLLEIKEETSAKQGFSIRKDILLHSLSTVREGFRLTLLPHA